MAQYKDCNFYGEMRVSRVYYKSLVLFITWINTSFSFKWSSFQLILELIQDF